MKKLVALLTAGVLCLGISMTVLAQEVPSYKPGDEPSTEEPSNPSTPTPSEKPDDYASATVNGEKVGVTYDDIEDETILSIVNDNKKLEQILKDSGYDVKPGQKVEGIFWADVNLEENITPDGKISLDLCIGDIKASGLKNNDIVYVYHWGKNGLEIYEAKVQDIDGNGFVKVSLDDLSPIAIVKVTSNGQAVAVDKKGNVVSEVKKAPRTGEF